MKAFDPAAVHTRLRDHEAGFMPYTSTAIADDHKAHYPGATPIGIRITGATDSGLLLGAQLVGTSGAETRRYALTPTPPPCTTA